jgi:hyaluronoglucosaminidase
MEGVRSFARWGIVEGFFGPLWSMSHRAAIFAFGAARGMNTYVYAPKDDPYHRARWREPYPRNKWRALVDLIRVAEQHRIEFVYAFHPGKGLCFSDPKPLQLLLEKATRFYDAGVQNFAILFDDIPSRLEHGADRRRFDGSLARAEGVWLKEILQRQPSSWKKVEWWFCPSYYTADPLLPKTFGAFEEHFLETLDEHLPKEIPCFWTGPLIVSKTVTLAHMAKIAQRLRRPLLLWDNYPVNDLSMRHEMHVGPLTGRDPRLPEKVYGYLNNPLLQEALSFIPLATCFDYARDPANYNPEMSWRRIVIELFGRESLPYWRAIRIFCEQQSGNHLPPSISADSQDQLKKACDYIRANGGFPWAAELRPWHQQMKRYLASVKIQSHKSRLSSLIKTQE